MKDIFSSKIFFPASRYRVRPLLTPYDQSVDYRRLLLHMKPSMIMLPRLFFCCLTLLAVGAEAFTFPVRVERGASQTTIVRRPTRRIEDGGVCFWGDQTIGDVFWTRSQSSSSLMATKKKKNDESKEREKIENPVELLLLYMTPWKNPNSIFVYLFLVVYCLGKYSESQATLQ